MKRLAAAAVLLLASLAVVPQQAPTVVASSPASGAALEPARPVVVPTTLAPAPRPSRAIQRPAPSPSPASRSRTHVLRKEVHSGYPTEAQWAALRRCESSGNYQARGTFYGAYQFDLSTWRSVGGSGNPADAPAEEQDRRALLLYAARGWHPWPVCGRYLR